MRVIVADDALTREGIDPHARGGRDGVVGQADDATELLRLVDRSGPTWP